MAQSPQGALFSHPPKRDTADDLLTDAAAREAGAAGEPVRGALGTIADLAGPAGRLEALYAPGEAAASFAVVVCHPHPLFGGTMHNKVVYHAARVFQQSGMPVLRFNFRGAGASEGTHDRGEGEQADLVAAMEWLHRETGLPLLVAGFSFGAYVALRACCEEATGQAASGAEVRARVKGLVALGLPIRAGDRSYSYAFLNGCTRPLLFVSGSLDEFGPADEVEAAARHAGSEAKLIWVEGVDHFFQEPGLRPGQRRSHGLALMQSAIREWLAARFLPAAATMAGVDDARGAS